MSAGATADLNGHEAGNGGYIQGTPTAPRALLYSERWTYNAQIVEVNARPVWSRVLAL